MKNELCTCKQAQQQPARAVLGPRLRRRAFKFALDSRRASMQGMAAAAAALRQHRTESNCRVLSVCARRPRSSAWCLMSGKASRRGEGAESAPFLKVHLGGEQQVQRPGRRVVQGQPVPGVQGCDVQAARREVGSSAAAAVAVTAD